MKKWTICILLFCAVATVTQHSSALFVDSFPGLNKMIEESDYVWIVFIMGCDVQGNCWFDYDVAVQRSLKGTAPKSKNATIAVNHLEVSAPSETEFWAGLRMHHQYLVFLNKNADKERSRADYISPHSQGCVFPLSAKIRAREIPGKTPREIIKNLIDKTIEIRELDLKILKEKAAAFFHDS